MNDTSAKNSANPEKEETRIVVLSPDSRLTPEILVKKITHLPIIIKITCWGLIMSGNKKEIQQAVKELRPLDNTRIFTKQRGYPPGDPRICRFQRGGGPRPGFHYLEVESTFLPLISKALQSAPTEDVKEPAGASKKTPITIEQLRKIIEEETEG
jgi:putative methanogenesis marker protein 6